MGPTIHDVARLAGTSKSTVSRYLNGQQVKKETQEALEKAIKELNFHRNANARRLVLDRTNSIAVVVDNISNIFYSGIIRGIETVANMKGYNCIFLSWTSNYENEISFLNLLYEGQVDGIILVSFQKRAKQDLEQIRSSSYPIALVGDHGEMDGIFSVDVDNAAGVYEIVEYLHGLGHRNIAYISGPDHAAANKYRFKGYLQAMEHLGLKHNPEWVVQSDWSNQGGYQAMKKLLQADGFTAVVASNDETAIGALRATQEHGLNVPKRMSVVGFDDITISEWVYPSLTTVRQPFQDIGMKAAQGLFRKIDGNAEDDGDNHYLLKPTLIIRDSCGKL
ncbi:transcriptional regulator, LacI family [Paenibacillus sp. UNC496MF]|uniref:LacI family DNA-binding transcriptional regulator n=1 Tax=Paenibacillus sp. UNC496MF TaxID=1502753 RepID=UPI0008ECF235|nr:LacI family DNA-binding transcriptional regulator [Paenibacillus sp. UNC496MF]SFI74358.1 transcriptional regulator, LacI family [Paenibacillus sp. UNC496MF]